MNQLMRFEDLREWLLSKVNDSVEVVGEDELILGFIRKLDAAPSATAAPPVEVRAPDRPDWAQQLPGAERYDRAARYEYIRTLNPRKFAALYNEALMGVHQFDDLVDRRRMKGEPVECGYDRTASLSAGHYVCTCGGACSRPDAQQPSHTTSHRTKEE